MEQLPAYVSIVFGLTTVLALVIFFFAMKKSGTPSAGKLATIFLVGSFGWLSLQALLGIKGVYSGHPDQMPPRIMLLGVLPALALIILLMITAAGRRFVDSLPLRNLTYLNVVRVPVELVLYWLFIHKLVPQAMTFEGRNLDILAGLTAPLVAYFAFAKNLLGRKVVLVWNLLALALLLNIVAMAVLSIPSPLQKMAFDQPNVAVLYFPFCWLPSFIVPLVLFGHVVSIRRLVRKFSDA